MSLPLTSYSTIDDINVYIENLTYKYYKTQDNYTSFNITFKNKYKSYSAAILLSRIIYWYKKTKFSPFYKFIKPCNHSYYRNGDSWAEEIAITHNEYNSAIKKIAYKIKKNVKIEKHDKPVEYWTDNDRVTYYRVNFINLFKIFKFIEEKNDVFFELNSCRFTKNCKPDLSNMSDEIVQNNENNENNENNVIPKNCKPDFRRKNYNPDLLNNTNINNTINTSIISLLRKDNNIVFPKQNEPETLNNDLSDNKPKLKKRNKINTNKSFISKKNKSLSENNNKDELGYSKDVIGIFNFWNTMKNLTTHKKNTKLYRNSLILIQKSLNSYSIEDITHAIRTYNDAFDSKLLDKSNNFHKVSLPNFIAPDAFLRKTWSNSRKYKEFSNIKSLLHLYATTANANEKLRPHTREINQSITKKITTLWCKRKSIGKSDLSYRDKENIIYCSNKLDSLFVHKDYKFITDEGNPVTSPSKIVNYFFEMLDENCNVTYIEVHSGWLISNITFDNFRKWCHRNDMYYPEVYDEANYSSDVDLEEEYNKLRREFTKNEDEFYDHEDDY